MKDIRRDPLIFATQLYRRFSPPFLTKIIASGITNTPPSQLKNLCAQIIDRPDLEENEIRKKDVTRELYRTGHLSQAIDSLPTSSSLRSIWASEKRILDNTSRLVIPAITPSDSGASNRRAAGNIHVLHVLNSCLPFSQSGYTIRSHRLIEAQEKIGIHTCPVTRPGYPVIIGRPFVDMSTRVNGTTYHHLLPSAIPTLPEESIAQHAYGLHQVVEQGGGDISIVHATTDYMNGIAAQAYAHSRNLPWVYEMRGMREFTWLASFPADEQKAVLRSEKFQLWHAKETELARQADAVIVLSETQKNDLIERGMDEESIWVLPHAYDIPPNSPLLTQAEARQQLGLPEADVYFGSVTSLVDYEGLDTLIYTLALLRGKGIDAKVALVGSGTAEAQLRSLARELSVDEHVLFPGKVTLEQSHLWYQALDFFAIPRRDTPVCRLITPLKPFEALAYGRPLLATKLPALDELTDHGVGVAVEGESPAEWAKAIEKNMPSSDSYAKMSTKALNFSRKITWEDNAKTTEQIYRTLL